MQRRSKPSLLVFADDWGRHPSSCQHLVRRLRAKYRVLWANTIGTRRPQANRVSAARVVEKLKNWHNGLQRVDRQMWVVDLPMLPNAGAGVARRLNQFFVSRRISHLLEQLEMQETTVLTTLPYVDCFLRGLTTRSLVYYITDDYSHWPGADRQALIEADRHMRQKADLVLPVSHALMEKYEDCVRREYFPHGVDLDHFAQVDQLAPHQLLANLPRPRIGFIGLIYEKIDFSLLARVARGFPHGSVVLVGPVDYCDADFSKLTNVHLMGKQPYDDVPRWMAGMDVLLLPYVNDEMIRQSGPLKVRECLAAGKPTVSVDVPEVRSLVPHVRIGATADEFVHQVELALSQPDTEQQRDARRLLVADDDWDRRAEKLDAWLSSL